MLTAEGTTTTELDERKSVRLQAAYDLPAGDTRLSLRLSRTFANLGGRVAESQFRTKSESILFNVDHNFFRSRAHTINGGVSFERFYAQSVSNFGGVAVAREDFSDRTTTVQARLQYVYRDLPLIGGNGVAQASVTHGLDALGAGAEIAGRRSRPDGEVDFTRFNFDWRHLWDLGHGLDLSLAAAGQRATTHLLASEEFGIGGARFGRAYDSSEYKGEHGVGFEARLGKTIRFEPDWAPTARLYGFYSLAQVWDDDQTATEDNAPSIATAGFGAAMNFQPIDDGPTLTAFGEKAIPLTRRPNRLFSEKLKPRYIVGGTLTFDIDE